MRDLPTYLPALVTPFDSQGELDLKGHTHNVRHLAETGIEGFLIGGSTGEGPYLEPGERGRLVKAVRRRRTHLMVGIAAETVRVGLRLVDEAVDAGADSLLVLTPTTMARNKDDAVARYFQTIADHSPVPVLLYSVPPYTGYSLPVPIVEKLSRHRNVVGMKDSSGDVVRLQAIVDATPSSFVLYNGASRALSSAMTVGCYGAITASGNYAPDLILAILKVASDDPIGARDLQRRMTSLSAAVEAHGVPGVKAAAAGIGLQPGDPRLPLMPMTKTAAAELGRLARNAGLA
ncbi:MAG TPA: dihydrodipicolinate synthase family protein [Acidimicrobiia bacterium]